MKPSRGQGEPRWWRPGGRALGGGARPGGGPAGDEIEAENGEEDKFEQINDEKNTHWPRAKELSSEHDQLANHPASEKVEHEPSETNERRPGERFHVEERADGQWPHGQLLTTRESTSKLALNSGGESKATKTKRRDKREGGEQQVSAGASADEQANQLIEAEQPNGSQPTSATNTQKKGLLEALLGERGKSWFEQKTVIVDIQNGAKKGDAKSRAKENNAAQQGSKSKGAAEESEENFKRLEESPEVDEARQGQVAAESPSGVPTFGSVPQRLTRLPYFTYHGQATRKRLEITRPREGEEHARLAQKQGTRPVDRYRSLQAASKQFAGSRASLGSRASSTGGANHSNGRGGSSSAASTVSSISTSGGGAGGEQRVANLENRWRPLSSEGRRASQLGFSNISNLFPDEPASVRLPKRHTLAQQQQQQQSRTGPPIYSRYKSASLLDLERTAASHQRARSLAGPQQVALSERRKSHFSALSPMTRRNSFSALQQQQQQVYGGAARQAARDSQQSLTQREQLQKQRQMATLRRQQLGGGGGGSVAAKLRGRPVSATGSYLGGAHQRSPSTSSLYHQQQQQQQNSYRLGSAGMSPLVDPDCPVHGDSPEGQPLPGGRRRYDTYNGNPGRNPEGQHQQPIYSVSQPDLLYGAGERDDLLDPYNNYPKPYYHPIYDSAYASQQVAYGGKATGAGYSPISPTGRKPQPLGAPPPIPPPGGATGQPAYYDSSSRFSLYHQAASEAGNGGGGGGGLGQTRTSLAPTSEQMRRILGYKPAHVPKPVHLHPQWAYSRPFIHLKPAGSGFGRSPTPPPDGAFDPDGMGDLELMDGYDSDTPRFAPFNRLQDNQAIRAVDFHPSGEVYAIGSNSRALRICAYPAEHELRHFDPFDPQQRDRDQQQAKPPRVLFKFLQVHRGSIYCVSFNPSGQLLATGSNDQTVHIVKYNSVTHNPDGEEFRLTMHNGTIRDLCFIDDSSGNGSSLLLSAGGGDNKIYVTDCDTITPFQSMAGHTQMVMALSHCGGAQFVSGSYDRTIRFWDLRSRSCTSIVSAPPTSSSMGVAGGDPNARHNSFGPASGPGAPVCALRVDPSGRLLASGHTDSTCMLYDIRGAKIIQTFRPHDDEIRAISFSPKSYYLLTGGYDGRLVVSDLQGDLTQPLPSACVAESQDKIVQAKWHPADFTFVSTSADKSATLWSLPGEIRN